MSNKTIMEEIRCPLGCKKNDQVVLEGRDMLHNMPGDYTVVKCNCCGLMRTNPRPIPKNMGDFYPDNYGPYIGTRVKEDNNTHSSLLKRVIRPIFKKVFEFNTERLPPLNAGRLLEIGCASGAFMHKMAQGGWQVQGIELSESAAQFVRELGYPIHVGPVETAPRPTEPFDLIVGWMVLEHLHDPIGCLRKLVENATPETWLVLSVPNAASIEFRIFKDKWYALQVPTHLYHFSPKTIKKVLYAGGWNLEKVHHQRNINNLIASFGYVLKERGYLKLGERFISFPENAGYFNYILYPISWLLSMFGQTGRMTIWARVRNDF